MPDPVGLGGEGKAPDPASSAPDAVRHRATLEAPEGPGPQGGGGKEQDAPQGAASKKGDHRGLSVRRTPAPGAQ